MDLTIKRVKEILIEAFPHWSQWDVDGLASFLMAFFKEEIKKDASYVVAATSELYSYFEEKVVGRGKIEKRDVRPGLVVHYLKSYPSFTKELKTLYKDKKLEEYYKQKYQEIDTVLVIEEVFSRYLDVDSMDPIVAFVEAIDAQVPFTKSQMPFWAIMREVAFECKGAPVEYFWIMVKERCLEGGIATNEVQWRQMKSRILSRIQNYGSAAAGMLQMVSAEELALRKLLNVVEELEEKFQNSKNTDLKEQDMITYQENSEEKAYRFSEMELTGMINLKKLFSNNQYTTDRFPEVYDGDIPARLKEEQELIDLGNDGILQLVQRSWTDALGVYRIGPLVADENETYEFTTEGHIVIDTEKIKKWVEIWNRNHQELNLTVPHVRFVVLMHELGHWLSHWASRNGKDAHLKDANHLQWNPGFEFPNNMTMEALANIICLWACEDIKDEKQRNGVLRALDALTPKNENGDVDTSNAYGAYKLIEGFNRSGVLEKLNAVRANWMLKDEFLFDFLKSSEKDVLKWLGERNPETVSIKDYKSNPQLEHKSVWDQGKVAKGSSILRRFGELPKRPN